jgi:hypothetical protein
MTAIDASEAWACTCAGEPELASSIQRADVIFEGRLVAVEAVQAELGIEGYTGALRYQFDVSRYFKGRLGPNLPVFTIDQSSACGREYSFALDHLIYARYTDGGLLADFACSRSRPTPFSDEDLDALGAGVEPASELPELELPEDMSGDPDEDGEESLPTVPIAGEAAAASCATSVAPGRPGQVRMSLLALFGGAALLVLSRKHRRG